MALFFLASRACLSSAIFTKLKHSRFQGLIISFPLFPPIRGRRRPLILGIGFLLEFPLPLLPHLADPLLLLGLVLQHDFLSAEIRTANVQAAFDVSVTRAQLTARVVFYCNK